MTDITPIPQFQKKLLEWFDQYGRHDLPWQHPRDPYPVWISEIMLQQTQVSTVIGYFQKFMYRFPTLSHLANASLKEVLQYWSGLGYYSRARNIHKTAIILMQEHQGLLPHDLETLKKLPGIGPSTAGAIMSSGFNIPAIVLDGNVKRVFIRLHALLHPMNHLAQEKQLWKIAALYLSKKRPADYTQAIMDFGATLCTPKQPQCTRCPMKSECLSHQQDLQQTLPTPKIKTAVKAQTLHWLIALDQHNHVLLEQRHQPGIWHRLWCFPDKKEKISLPQTQKKQWLTTLTFDHRLTHRQLHIRAEVWQIKRDERRTIASSQHWFSIKKALQQGIPKPVSYFLTQLNMVRQEHPL